MKQPLQFTPNNLRVSDFLAWQREGSLDLQPRFQRRSVWKPGAKSFLIDTVVRGLPVPLVFLRERVDLTTSATIREVVDGQQRLRTLISFIDPSALRDFGRDDKFIITRTHNPELGGRSFGELPDKVKKDILGYRFSVQTLPEEMDDAAVLEIFARLNSTGQRLNHQELRNAAYFGEFKTLMYDLGYLNTERWLDWGVFTGDQLARMAEVELSSDLMYNMLNGLSGKSQPRLNKLYGSLDASFLQSDVAEKRFNKVMDEIDEHYGHLLSRTIYTREVHFFTLFVYTYDLIYGLDSPMTQRIARRLPKNYSEGLTEVSRRFRELEVPASVLDAVARASADYGRRATRLKFMRDVVAGDA